MNDKKHAALALAVVALMLVPVLAFAARTSESDPNDTKGLLDVERVLVRGKTARAAKHRFKMITFARWNSVRVWDKGYFVVQIDARGDSHFEHYALVRSDGYGMHGYLFRDRRKQPDHFVTMLDAWKPTKNSVTVKIPLRKLEMPRQRTYYRWVVKSLMTGNNCQSVCIDRIPDDGARRRLVVPPPSPTPTVDPTLSPTPSIDPDPSPSVTVDPEPTPSATSTS